MDVSRFGKKQDCFDQGSSAAMDPHAPQGQELLTLVTSLTGLPPEWVERELHSILAYTGESSDGVTVPALKAALLKYLAESPFALGSSPELH
jgi:hypothetical protein